MDADCAINATSPVGESAASKMVVNVSPAAPGTGSSGIATCVTVTGEPGTLPVTVRVAGLLVTAPSGLETTTSYCPASLRDQPGIMSWFVVEPTMWGLLLP